MTLNIKNQDAIKELGNPLSDEGDVKLPFPAPTFWVMNGSAHMRKEGGAGYFGGWATGAEELLPIIEELGKGIPARLKQQDFVTKSGESVPVYSTRYLTAVPIIKRLSSVSKADGVRYPGYKKGASPHIQILCLLAFEEDKTLVSWLPVVLSAKGYQVGYLRDAFAKWDRESAKVRRQFAPGLPSNLFYCNIGTFGDKPNVEQKGTGNNTSPITPVELWLPKEELDEARLKHLFVGDAVVDEMLSIRQQAQEWVVAWKKQGAPKEQVEAPLEDEPSGVDDMPYGMDRDMPA